MSLKRIVSSSGSSQASSWVNKSLITSNLLPTLFSSYTIGEACHIDSLATQLNQLNQPIRSTDLI